MIDNQHPAMIPRTKGASGTFEINGRQRKVNDFRKICTYIPQEFSMLPLLNVQETIAVAIDLKLPQNSPAAQKNQLVTIKQHHGIAFTVFLLFSK